MEKDLLKELRDKYQSEINELTQKKNLLLKLFHQKEMYEDNPIIQQYLGLNKNIESLEEEIKLKKEYIQKKSVSQYLDILTNCSEDDTNVFVYITDVFDSDNNLCSYYIDIISESPKEIPVTDKEEFEKSNNIIFLDSYIKNDKTISNRYDCQGFDLKYIMKTIQEKFIIDTLEKGHTRAMQRILSKGKK